MTVDLSRFNSPEATRMGAGVPVGENDPEVQAQLEADRKAAEAASALVVDPPAIDPPVVPVAEVPPPAPVVVAPAEEEDDLVKKVNGQWEIRVRSLIAGGEDQIYRGKTKNEVIRKMAEGQANAQKRIRELDRQKRLKNILLEPEVLAPAPTFERRQLSTDEQYTLSNQLQDPAKAPAAIRKLIEAELGAPLDTVRTQLNRTSLEAEENRSRVIAKEWVENNPDFFACQPNIDKVGEFFKERGWSITTKNLDIAFSFLDGSGELLDRPSETPSEPVSDAFPVPAAAPAAAPVAAAPAVPPAAPASALPAPSPAVPRIRPGSTGITRDDTSVRPPSQPATPVTPKVVLTVEEYRKTPMAEVRRRYNQEPAYRAAIDELIAANRI